MRSRELRPVDRAWAEVQLHVGRAVFELDRALHEIHLHTPAEVELRLSNRRERQRLQARVFGLPCKVESLPRKLCDLARLRSVRETKMDGRHDRCGAGCGLDTLFRERCL